MSIKKTKKRTASGIDRVVKRQRSIQASTDATDKKQRKATAKAPASSPRREPRSPLPPQHLVKPGLESELNPRPKFAAPYYLGSAKLSGKVALITGGDSGIGRAVAVLFAREGANVAIVFLSEESDARETKAHVENEGRECMLVPGDVRDPKFCRSAVSAVIKRFGALDILVNNAAFQEHAEAIEDVSDDHFDLTIKTNIYGYFNMAKSSLARMKEGSCIINTGSETGLYGSKNLLDYSATKGAIHAFTKALAANLISRGIRVNAVAPGPVWTPLNPADQSADDVAKFGAKTDLKRPAQPEEISPAYVFLASAACSSYITGIVLPVMGNVPS